MRTLRGNRADYRRCHVPGGSFFFTVVTERRAAILGNDLARDLSPAWPTGPIRAFTAT
ncbi:MAG: hypothetical protein KDJ28_15115 [Candidatus Competibacteraceae bacterium]|nr:hypothetical protein [Candidatus Competibacteraceae bacterium]